MGGRPNYGRTAQERTKRLLEALLAYANDELEGAERLQIEANWQTQNKLVVRTKVRFLEELTAKYQQDGKLNTDQIKEALTRLKDWLEILEDNRTKTQGSEDWHFTLKLWSKDKQENLKRFEFEWESRRTKKSESTDSKVRPNPPENPSEARAGIDWRQVCRDMLSAQNQGRLTTNPLTTGDGVAFELNEIYVPLGLVERKQRDRRSGDVSPEQGSLLYEPEAQDEIVQTFQHNQFFEQVLRQGRSRRIAIIGEPGAGKTTLLQKIAAWVLGNTCDVPIWISLADLQQGQTLKDYILQTWLERALPHIRKLSPKAVPSLLEVPKTLQDALANEFCNGRVWLLLDAADEMVVESGNALAQIANQLIGWITDARVVLTCRLNVWDAGKNALEAFDTYRNLDFSYGDDQTPDQVRQFIQRWFKSNPELGDRLRAELDQPGKERIKDAVKNPLRLALLCLTWGLGRGGLPNTKAGLYQQFTEALYEWKQDRFPTSSSQRQELNKALGELALLAISEEKTKFRLRYQLICSVLGKSDEDLFQLALQLGWLNQVGVAVEVENRGEKVYAFFHPTFQEYFAAQAIDNWHFFLNDDPFDSEQSTYRIFDQQWKEVILLWLGRKNLPQTQKVAFIRQLVTFDDGCDYLNPYGLRAYLLAIAGIAELENIDSAEFLDWSHWLKYSKWLMTQSSRIKQKPEKWSTFFTLIERAAQGRLRETEYSRAIETIVDVLRESQHSRTYHQCLVALGETGVGNHKAINAVIELLQNIQDSGKLDDWTLFQCVMTLRKIGVGNQEASAALQMLLKRIESIPDLKRHSCELFSIIKNNKLDTTDTLNKISQSQERVIYEETGKILELIDSSNIELINTIFEELQYDLDAHNWLFNQLYEVNYITKMNIIKALSILLSNTQNSRTRWKIADSLGQIDPGNVDANKALISLMRNNDHRSEAVWSLKKTLQGELFALTVSGLKDSLDDEDERCYEIIWHCAQNMTYPDFYRAWHKQSASTPLISRRLNLAQLPQDLCTAIANDSSLSQTIHLICIDASKFIDRDNPAAKIYAEMVKSGCPKCSDGTPKTMPELQNYWDLLESDKRVVLVFYEGAPLSMKGTQPELGFSGTFLDALSKFDGAICVITDQSLDNIPLQCIIPNEAIAQVVEWIKKITIEG